MSPIRGGRVAAGMLIVTAALTLVSGSAFSRQEDGATTPFPQRSVPSAQPLGIAKLVVTVTLADLPVSAVVAEATAAGRSGLEIFALATVQWLRIASAQDRLIQILTQTPYDATLVEQSLRDQNSITIEVMADRIQSIRELAGVLSVRAGGSGVPLLPAETPSRPGFQPGTRLPPLEPPGYNN